MGQLGRTTKQLRQNLSLFGLGQRLEGLQKMSRCVSHGEPFYACRNWSVTCG